MFALVGMAGVPELVDVGKTSREGAFAGIGRPSDVSAAKFTVLRKTIGSGNDKIVCMAKTFTGV
jgi:hypothetical protein